MTDPATSTGYKDADLVYVDPESKTVVGPLEWSRAGNPKAKLMPENPEKKGEGRRGGGKRYYPWGTYRSMKRVFQLEGKLKKVEPTLNLDQAIEKAMKEPFWD
jgi:hypothetical protein